MMKNKVIISCLFGLISICSYSQNSQVDSVKENAIEDTIMNRILKFPEVQNAGAYIDSFSKGKHGIAIMIEGAEDSDSYYSVHVGYNGELRFETYFLFFVNKQNLAIRYLDATSDLGDSLGSISLNEWRDEEKKGIDDWRQKK